MKSQSHRLIHNRHRGQTMAVPETARGRSKGGRGHRIRLRSRAASGYNGEYTLKNINVAGLVSNHDGQVVAGGTIQAQSLDNKATEGKVVTDTYTTMYTPTSLSQADIDLSQWWYTSGPIRQQSSKTIVLSVPSNRPRSRLQ